MPREMALTALPPFSTTQSLYRRRRAASSFFRTAKQKRPLNVRYIPNVLKDVFEFYGFNQKAGFFSCKPDAFAVTSAGRPAS